MKPIPSNLPDAELAALVAEAHGWVHPYTHDDGLLYGYPPPIPPDVVGGTSRVRVPPYATSLDAISPCVTDFIRKSLFSQRAAFWGSLRAYAKSVLLCDGTPTVQDAIGMLLTRSELARGFCFALLVAKGFTVEDVK